jgi:hypothetical protein
VIFNNKEDPVRKYEPFYTNSQLFEFNVQEGVSPIIFYDPVQLPFATLFPDNTWSKMVFDPWSDQKWDGCDTVLLDPLNDDDVGDYFRRITQAGTFRTWYEERVDGSKGPLEQTASEKTALFAQSSVYGPPRSLVSVDNGKQQFKWQ